MSNFVAVNFKYYKDSQAKGEIGHVMRVFAKNTNAIESLSHENFGSDFNLIDKYDELLAFAKQNTKEKTGRAYQDKKANTFLDGVLAFSNEQMLELKKDPLWKTKMSQHIEQFMLEIEQKTGFMPVGWKFHLDEGTMEENGNYRLNHHAQMIFMNHDKETGKAPLREFQKRKGDSIWSELQTLAGEKFKDLGFVRGVSAEDTHKKHLEKDKYIDKKQESNVSAAEHVERGIAIVSEQAEKLYWVNKTNAARLTAVSKQLEALESLHTNDERYDNKFTMLSGHISRVKNNFEKLYNNKTSFRMFISSLETTFPRPFKHAKDTISAVLAFFGSEKPKLEYKQKIKEIKTLLQQVSEDGYDTSAIENLHVRLEEAKNAPDPSKKTPQTGSKPKN
jgi:hypothetical protein